MFYGHFVLEISFGIQRISLFRNYAHEHANRVLYVSINI